MQKGGEMDRMEEGERKGEKGKNEKERQMKKEGEKRRRANKISA